MGLGQNPSVAKSKKWYAIHVMSHHERKVASRLSQQGFEVFLPEYQTRSQRKDRVKMIQKPLFPGYLFIFTKLLAEQRLEILKTPSVVRMVGTGSRPIAVPNEQIESVRLLLCSAADARPEQDLCPGQKVLVTDGPLKGVVGRVEKTPRGEKIIVSVDLLSRSVSASLGKASVSPYLDP